MTKNNKLKETVLYITAVAASVFLLFFFVIGTWIGYEAKQVCLNAKSEYSGDCVEALGTLVRDEKQSYRARNNAIWTLGQLGDARALAALQQYYTGVIPDREPLDQMISQYELRKAIRLVEGGTNISAFIWRTFYDETH